MADATMVRQQIETLDGRFSEAFSRGDVAALAAAYTEDAKLMPPDSDIVTGRQGIQQYFQGVRDMGVREAVLEQTSPRPPLHMFALASVRRERSARQATGGASRSATPGHDGADPLGGGRRDGRAACLADVVE